MTPAEIIYHRRVRLLALADELGNVSKACCQMGISRTRYYEWRSVVAEYGLETLMPKARRSPQLPNQTPTHIIEDLLTLAVVEPTLGCRQYADRLAERGYTIGDAKIGILAASIIAALAGAAILAAAARPDSPAPADDVGQASIGS